MGDQVIYITQRPFDLDISPKGEWVTGNAGEVVVSAETEGCGKVDGAGAYSLGSEVTLTAVADDGYEFLYWTGATDTTECKQPISGTKQKPIVISPITYANLHGATHANPETYQEGMVVAFTPPSGRTGYTFMD